MPPVPRPLRACQFVASALLAGLLAAGSALPFVGTLGKYAKAAAEDFAALPAGLDVPAPAQSSRIHDADGGLMATIRTRDRTVVPGDRIAPVMRQALVDIEDHRFFRHGALDLRAVLRALGANADSGRVAQGASTLTQQYVKNVFVEAAGNDTGAVRRARRQTLDRKVRELRYAIRLEKTRSKEQILTDYLNIAFFGRQAYGVEAAAERYFSVHAADLSLPQAALLAGLVQSPTAYDPVARPRRAKERRDTVLRTMARYGTITGAQARRAIGTPLGLRVTAPRQGCAAADDGAAFFCDYVRRVVLDDPAFGATAARRRALWQRGGLRIRTTLVPKAQQALHRSVTSHVRPSDDAAAAMAVVQPGTGRIVAMGQSRDYGVGAHRTQINLGVGTRMGGGLGFPTGSVFKPVVAAAALENGIRPSRAYPSPYAMSWPAMADCRGGRFPGTGEVHNDSRSLVGPFRMPEAMARSVNTYFAQLEADTGLCEVAAMAGRLGITGRADGSPLRVVPSLALGSNDLTPLDVAGAYAAFAAHGTYCSPVAITSVTAADGRELAVPRSRCRRAMSARTADAVTGMLRGVVEDGTGRPAALTHRDSAGKTGTTDSSKQVWFAAYTPELSGAVVVGDPARPRDLDGRRVGGDIVTRAFGGTLAGPVWRDAVEGALDGQPAGRLASGGRAVRDAGRGWHRP
ncbi:transglycosylase domain-containing protein [Streptomyces sp. AV19]|uniref:transglycosylase domain-containing protein n=1 Tax=Streptomyces sp. AV19 TaxID=2793068 RepID=UPI0018FE4EA8|nr:transglycosylase domain-containing protein [Streptomyces sp. AV19]MBH1934209.1 transglycosylase domain-containing protein [Streptomyces sp. AV19]MDG4533871.1 transglycosylase domain-containing protein [Streptomyces sp. AV19]